MEGVFYISQPNTKEKSKYIYMYVYNVNVMSSPFSLSLSLSDLFSSPIESYKGLAFVCSSVAVVCH